jgi:hypothetical protein
MAKIYAPNKEYTSISAGVMFFNGEAETDNENALNYFKNSGYEVIEDQAAPLNENNEDQQKDPAAAKKNKK